MAEDYLLEIAGGGDEQGLQSIQIKDWNPIIVFVSADQQSLLNKEALIKVEKIETHIQGLARWKQVCLAKQGSTSECDTRAFTSGLSFLKLAGYFGKVEDLT